MPRVNTPKGIRTPVASVKGRCPRPLDDGGEAEMQACFHGPLTQVKLRIGAAVRQGIPVGSRLGRARR